MDPHLKTARAGPMTRQTCAASAPRVMGHGTRRTAIGGGRGGMQSLEIGAPEARPVGTLALQFGVGRAQPKNVRRMLVGWERNDHSPGFSHEIGGQGPYTICSLIATFRIRPRARRPRAAGRIP